MEFMKYVCMVDALQELLGLWKKTLNSESSIFLFVSTHFFFQDLGWLPVQWLSAQSVHLCT
jgi:hypothetical protein